jgi:hypothetical protein
MKFNKAITFLSVLAMLAVVLLGTGNVAAQAPVYAYATSFTTSITYQNVGTDVAHASIVFYPAGNGTGIPVSLADLAKGASTSLNIGSLAQIGGTFSGTAVVSSDQPLAVTGVQLPIGNPIVKNRPLSNGFDTGSSTVLIATALKAYFSATSIFSIQNADSVDNDFTVSIYDANNPAGAPYVITETAVPSGAGKVYDMGTVVTVPPLPATLNGSVKAVAKRSGPAPQADGSIVGSVVELGTNTANASAFEGVASGANKVYMPSALCLAFGGTSSAYAVQNAGGAATNVTVLYDNGKTETKNVLAGAKVSFLGCGAANTPGYSGSATLTADAGGLIIAIGKVSGLGLSTAFVGGTSGSQFLAFPYIRWSETQFSTGARQHTSIAIQNIGAPLAAGAVVVKYVDYTGAVLATQTMGAIATGAKVNSNPMTATPPQSEFGYYGAIFGGGAIIVAPAGAQLVAIARVSSFVVATGSTAGEDYNAIAIAASPVP